MWDQWLRRQKQKLRPAIRHWLRRNRTEYDQLEYWRTRARQFGRRAVFNLRHAEPEADQVTEMQRRTLYPLLREQLHGDERVILDFGSGTGRFAGDLASITGGITIAVEPVAELVSYAQRSPNVSYLIADGAHLPLPNASVDVVWVCLVLGGFSDARLARAAGEIERVLKPGGLLFLVENTANGPGTPHWRFRSVEHYAHLFKRESMRRVGSYIDSDEEVSIMCGRRPEIPGPPLTTVLFCGAESPYGASHLEPLLAADSIRVALVVFPTSDRWRRFREALAGEPARATWREWPGRVASVARRLWFRWRADPPASDDERIGMRTSELWRVCHDRGVQTLLADDVNAEGLLSTLRRVSPDLLISAAYPQIFARPLLAIPSSGALNSHPSLLPRCRGASPIFWAIASGESETAVTFHYMTEKVDAGDIATQIRLPIHPDDTYATLYERVLTKVPEAVRELDRFLVRPIRSAVRQDPASATYFREEREIHRRIFWSSLSAREIVNLVRAANGRAFFLVGNRIVHAVECEAEPGNRNVTNCVKVPPGTVVDLRGGLCIRAAEGFVRVKRWRAWRRWPVSFNVGQVLS